MRHLNRLAGHAFAVIALTATAATAEMEGTHGVFVPEAVEWSKGPPTLPPGAEAAVLYGSPAEEGLFALRLKFPAGYHVPAHHHPKPEVVTVISGSVRLGHGEDADPDATELLGPGALFAIEPGMAHFIYTDEETVVQLNSVGPFGIVYVDPQDDPVKSQ